MATQIYKLNEKLSTSISLVSVQVLDDMWLMQPYWKAQIQNASNIMKFYRTLLLQRIHTRKLEYKISL